MSLNVRINITSSYTQPLSLEFVSWLFAVEAEAAERRETISFDTLRSHNITRVIELIVVIRNIFMKTNAHYNVHIGLTSF